MSETVAENSINAAVAEGGAYEIIKKRLLEQGKKLSQEVGSLNEQRLNEFGSADLEVAARIRVRTENNCIARDIVQVGEYLLFGYNVFIGLKKETLVEDVFALFTLKKDGENYDMEPVEFANTFLADTQFVKDFKELYRYYKNTTLLELTVKDGKLLMGFQIGERIEDIRVFRWAMSPEGVPSYIDNRGERDIQLPPAYDFEWQECGRENIVHGKHPHLNIEDTLFVECVGGDLTVKIENNTADGLGIFREPVENSTQSIDDGQYFYARLGDLVLLKILPYKEESWRYLVFNTLTQAVVRIDAIGASCVQLPEDHGIVFPGGYYLQSGEVKTFGDDVEGLKFKRMIRSPNGEDVLYVFYEPVNGVVALLSYNMIAKKLQNPILGHGYALAEDGCIVLFSAEEEPTRVHPMQIWITPFFSDEFASKQPENQSFYGRIGNAPLVRGISDLYSICRATEKQQVSVRLYEELSRSALQTFDDHYWLEDKKLGEIPALLREISETSELAIDEFEKVQSIRQQSTKALENAEETQQKIIADVRVASWQTAEDYVATLNELRQARGHLATIKEYRYIDVQRIEAMNEELIEQQNVVSERTVAFLSKDNALDPYNHKIETINADIEKSETVAELQPVIDLIEESAQGLDLLSELLATLKVSDATVRTQIIDAISEVYSRLNQSKANAHHKKKNIGSEEATAEFAAQFKLFSQSITNALSLADSPSACDEQMSRLLVQLEELESQFSAYDAFLTDIMSKRDEIYEVFEAHKQQLLDQRQRKAQSIADAASRAIDSIERRSSKFNEADQLNTYFASDALVLKVREFVAELNELEAAVKADDIEARFKAVQEQALRILRDKSDIYEGGGSVIKLGPRHKFSVNQQDLDLTIIPRNDVLNIHLTGTEFFEPIENSELLELKPYWDMNISSESPDVYRAEYLAYQILESARMNRDELSMEVLGAAAVDEKALMKLVRDFATPRYKEGYEKGIHDHDAALILTKVVPALASADLLRFDPLCRGFAQVFWANREQLHAERLTYDTWIERAQSATQMQDVFANSDAQKLLADDIRHTMQAFVKQHPIDIDEVVIARAADYLVQELGQERPAFICSKYAQYLASELRRSMDDESWRRFQMALEKMMGWPAERWSLSSAWLKAMVDDQGLEEYRHYIPEAAGLINADERIERRPTEVDLNLSVEGLMGDHPRIEKRRLQFSLDEFLKRVNHHCVTHVKNYHRYQELRQRIADEQRKTLRLNEFKPRPLSSFVRNRLINESYLPIIGDNLAKQMGTIGDSKRTDLMGLLMMISPPGYGKTTLMEYVASRLGLIFMKINCPSLGHDVMSLDPATAPNATARQELEKLNLGLEMGNNVMLYLDDIQHTHPEFLQKFISLCDGTRRIEGVWKGNTKTYDMRGKKFCVVMAGNPYTESGEVFKIPDMLANRADIYNLGDILGGMDEQFGLSYLENSLTSNQVLAPLATRDMQDVYLFFDMALGKQVATTDLKHQYSGAEVAEIVDVLKKMFMIRDVVLKVNQQYIASAAQADKYRTEPPFKLQGSYRNMNKMAEKISAVMNEAEMQQMISDHYQGEAQLLTTGAEENLLKLAELRGTLSDAQSERWEKIKEDFQRNQAMGGDDADTGQLVVGQLIDLSKNISGISEGLGNLSRDAKLLTRIRKQEVRHNMATGVEHQTNIEKALEKIGNAMSQFQTHVEVNNDPVPGIDKLLSVLATTIESSIFPLVRSMDKKLDIDLRTHDKMTEVSNQLKILDKELKAGKFQSTKSHRAHKPKPQPPTQES